MSEWDLLDQGRTSRWGAPKVSVVRVALLFSSAAIALALIATPMLDRNTRPRANDLALAGDLDRMSTGSTQRAGSSYVIRRSVLQRNPSAVCVIRADGLRSGDC